MDKRLTASYKTHKKLNGKKEMYCRGEICNLMLQFTQIKVTFFCLEIDFFFLKFVQHVGRRQL